MIRSSLKFGPIDFHQVSTWRGLIGVLTVAGIRISPALADQIALLAVTLLSLIELIRNEYARASRSASDQRDSCAEDALRASPCPNPAPTAVPASPASPVSPASPSPTPSSPEADSSQPSPDSGGFNNR